MADCPGGPARLQLRWHRRPPAAAVGGGVSGECGGSRRDSPRGRPHRHSRGHPGKWHRALRGKCARGGFDRPLHHSHEPDPRTRPAEPHPPRRARRPHPGHPRGGLRPRPLLPAGSQLSENFHDRRECRQQLRWSARAQIRGHPGLRDGAGSGQPPGRNFLARQQVREGCRRLQPARPLHRERGDPRRDHESAPQAGSRAGGQADPPRHLRLHGGGRRHGVGDHRRTGHSLYPRVSRPQNPAVRGGVHGDRPAHRRRGPPLHGDGWPSRGRRRGGRGHGADRPGGGSPRGALGVGRHGGRPARRGEAQCLRRTRPPAADHDPRGCHRAAQRARSHDRLRREDRGKARAGGGHLWPLWRRQPPPDLPHR